MYTIQFGSTRIRIDKIKRGVARKRIVASDPVPQAANDMSGEMPLFFDPADPGPNETDAWVDRQR